MHAEAAALAQSSGQAQAFASAVATDQTLQSCLGSSSNAVAKAIATANSSGGNANANAAAAVRHGPLISLLCASSRPVSGAPCNSPCTLPSQALVACLSGGDEGNGTA